MYKFMIVFHKPKQRSPMFERQYTELLAKIEQMPDIQRRQVVHVRGSTEGPSKYDRILEVYFEDQPTMEAALRSEAGQAAGATLYQMTHQFETIFAEVYEETGGQTQTESEEE